MSLPGDLVAPHVGGVTRETVVRTALTADQNATGPLAGDAPRDVVT
ncbi:hypothetical protein [Streptomyces brasiliensis]|nr:hypothetical protein [Streptomyces brasiliensis]